MDGYGAGPSTPVAAGATPSHPLLASLSVRTGSATSRLAPPLLARPAGSAAHQKTHDGLPTLTI